METELAIGIIGFGGAGLAHAGHFNTIAGCKVRAVYDPKPGGRDRAARRLRDVTITEDLDRFLRSGVDAVSVCSPNRLHAEHVVASLAAGKHVLCEKPLADSMEGCGRILQAQKDHPNRVLAVQHQMRFLPLHIRMKELIAGGELGAVSYIEGYYVHNLIERAARYDPWRFEDDSSPLVFGGCHFVDLLRWLLADEVEGVMGMANHMAFPEYPESDLNVILLRFTSGVIGKVVVALGAGRPQDYSVRVYGSDRCIENNLLFDGRGGFRVLAKPFIQKDSHLRRSLLRQWIGGWRRQAGPVLLARAFEALMQLAPRAGEYAVAHYPMRVYEHGFAVRQALLDFVGAIRTGGRPRCTATDAAESVAVCLAGVEAYRSGRTVAVNKYRIPQLQEQTFA
jgi:predicted dehydrogenase